MACHPRATCHIARCCHLANSVSWSQSYVSHFRFLPPGEFNGMSSQSHLPHCRVLPPGEFSVMIPKPHATFRVLPPGEFNGMSFHSHVPHCMVLPLGEFSVMIPEPPATFQGPVTWQISWHVISEPRAILQGERIPSAILKIVFRHILLFCFSKYSLAFGEWRLSYRLRYTCSAHPKKVDIT